MKNLTKYLLLLIIIFPLIILLFSVFAEKSSAQSTNCALYNSFYYFCNEEADCIWRSTGRGGRYCDSTSPTPTATPIPAPKLTWQKIPSCTAPPDATSIPLQCKKPSDCKAPPEPQCQQTEGNCNNKGACSYNAKQNGTSCTLSDGNSGNCQAGECKQGTKCEGNKDGYSWACQNSACEIGKKPDTTGLVCKGFCCGTASPITPPPTSTPIPTCPALADGSIVTQKGSQWRCMPTCNDPAINRGQLTCAFGDFCCEAPISAPKVFKCENQVGFADDFGCFDSSLSCTEKTPKGNWRLYKKEGETNSCELIKPSQQCCIKINREPTPTPTPTGTPTPAPTINPGLPAPNEVLLNLAVKINGIPVPGKNPRTVTRPVTVIVQSQKKETRQTGTIKLEPGEGLFKTDPIIPINLGTAVPVNTPINLVIKSDFFVGFLPNITLQSGQNSLSSTPLLQVGIAEDGNEDAVSYYNALFSCFGNKVCSNKSAADLNDDGKVDGSDFNFFVRSLAIIEGLIDSKALTKPIPASNAASPTPTTTLTLTPAPKP